MNLNRVFLIGRLTQDPETKVLPSGQSVTNFGLATSRYFTDKSGEKQERTQFHNLVLFGKLAEIASQYLRKGSLAFFEGRLRTRSWEDSSGSKRYRTEVVVQRLQLAPKSLNPQPVGPSSSQGKPQQKKKKPEEDIPVIEEEEIDVKDIPF